MTACGATLPNPATHGDTHTHECVLDDVHDYPGPRGGVPVRKHRCACGTQWMHDLRSDGRSATLIRFPSDRTPQVDLRRASSSPELCLMCAEPVGSQPTHEFSGLRYHRGCRSLFESALQSADNLLASLRSAPDPTAQRLHLVRFLAALSRG